MNMNRSVASLLFFIAIISGEVVLAATDDSSSFMQGASTPIEITADSLTVKRLNEIAVFSGNVEAVQSDMNLRSDVMTVHYKSKKIKGEPGNTISKIDVDGNVFLTTPSETAQGKEGLYDVDNKMLTLSGEVVLTQADNIIKGSKLIYDLTTGKSELFSDKSLPGAEGVEGGRVRGLFVPENKE